MGMELAGHECAGYIELDKFARKSYEAIFNTEGEYTAHDITTVRADELPKCECWCFGFPCQDISVAGKLRGLKGDRSGLFFTVTKLIKELKEEDRPDYLFIENVKNLLRIDKGFGFLQILAELDTCGYDVEWQVINSKYYGVPQNRERVFIIGHFRGQSAGQIFPIGTTSNAGEIILYGHSCINGHNIIKRVFNPAGISPTLTAVKGGQSRGKNY